MFKKPSSKLSVDVPMGVQFIHPPNPGQLPLNELVLQGTITLTLTKPKKVDEILVKLQNKASICAPGLVLEEVLLDRETSVQVRNLLEPGVHTYAFEFPIPVSPLMSRSPSACLNIYIRPVAHLGRKRPSVKSLWI